MQVFKLKNKNCKQWINLFIGLCVLCVRSSISESVFNRKDGAINGIEYNIFEREKIELNCVSFFECKNGMINV